MYIMFVNVVNTHLFFVYSELKYNYQITTNAFGIEDKFVSIIGYEPADLTVHPPPKTIEGGFIFFA